MNKRSSFYVLCVLIGALALGVGCSKQPSDSQVASDVQNKFNADSGLQGKQLSVQSDKGTVTISGVVDNDAQREAAARYAASEPGVRTVINNLQVGATPAAPPPAPAAAIETPAPQAPSPKPSATRSDRHSRKTSAAAKPADQDAQLDEAGNYATPAPAAEAAANATPPPPAAQAPPPPQEKVTIESGTTMAIRLVDAINSETAQQGQVFHATLNSPLAVNGEMAIPAGYDVEGHVVAVQSAGKFAGKSLLELQLDRVKVGDKYYNIQTDAYKREGSSRGKGTATKVGGGAVLGAIIGGLAGGGKGAAIGSVAGAGVGGGVQAASKAQQIDLPSETVLTFTLRAPLSVVPTTKGPDQGRPTLNNNQ